MLIGIGHVKRAGKDSAANALVRDLGYTKVAFADSLKDMALKADPLVIPSPGTVNIGIGHGHLSWLVRGSGWEQAKDRWPEVRRFLQNLGLAVREVLGEDAWVDQVLGRYPHPIGKLVIPDVRFLNEAEAIKQAGGYLVRIDRPGAVAEGHRSELELVDYSDWDLIISNDKSITELEGTVVTWAKGLERRAVPASVSE